MGQPQRILVVEDDSLQRMTLCDLLAGAHGYEVVGVGSGGEVRAALGGACRGFAAILLDVGLPDGDGLALCAELRGGGYGGPIIILTGDHDARGGLAAGATDCLCKPVRSQALVDSLRKRLGPPACPAGLAIGA